MRTSLLLIIVTLLSASVSLAQETKKKPQQRKRRPNPVLQPIKDKPGLPRVLLIGDSISMGYTLPVRKLMEGKANVHRPLTNCGPTTRGLEQIDEWLGKGKWDVIHFNWGLHDLKYMGPEGQNLAEPKAEGSHQQVPPEAYEKNLTKLVLRMKQTGAKLIWCSTTPVPEGAKGRVVGHSKKYNEIAARVMEAHNVEIHNLYAFALKNAEKIQRKANVHYTLDGSQQLGKQVAAKLEKALE